MTIDVLILAAFEPELAPFSRDERMAPVGAQCASTASDARRPVAFGLVGVGLVTAAVGAAHQIAMHAPRAVVLVGTCGAYASAGLAIGDVIVARATRLVDLSSLEGKSELIESVATAIETDAALLAAMTLAGARPVQLATTLGITVDDEAAARIASGAQVDVEHLETHAVAMACAACAVPFVAVLGVANDVGSRGRAQWRDHHREAEAAAARCVTRWLQSESRS